ncbi:hypothetical protein HYX58_02465 [Candidatus Dependentiae bacterium]|nr:hypothetical protein [Candidatus Dependentiae bacterium]
MILHYFLIFIFSIQLTAMEKNHEVPTLPDKIGLLPKELQSIILLSAHIPPHSFKRCGKNEYAAVDENGNLAIGLDKPSSAESTYFHADGSDDKVLAYTNKLSLPQKLATSVNTMEIAQTHGQVVHFFDTQTKKIQQCKLEDKCFHSSLYSKFLKTETHAFFINPLTGYYTDKQVHRHYVVPSLYILDLKSGKNIETMICISHTMAMKKRSQIYHLDTKTLNKLNKKGCHELHFIAEPLAETPHLIPLLFKVSKYSEKKHELSEHFISALFNIDEEVLYGWPIKGEQIEEEGSITQGFSKNHKINIKHISVRIPTKAELKQKELPADALSKTDHFILGLNDKAIAWTQRALKFIDTSDFFLPSARDGITLLQEINDAAYAKKTLKLKNRAQFVLATKDGVHGNILNAIKSRTVTLLQEGNPRLSEAELKKFLKVQIQKKK